MMRTRLFLAGSAAALGIGLLGAPPAEAQVVCDSNIGLIGTATGGPPSFACGSGAVASGDFSVAVGPATIASGLYSTALGNDAQALGVDSLAVGQNAHATTDFATAIGTGSRATQPATTALGILAHADGYGSTALGYYAYATGLNSTAIGRGSYANADGAISVGRLSVVNSTNGVALGNYAAVNHTNSVALGANTTTTAANQVNVGNRTIGSLAPGVLGTDAVNVNQLNAATVGLAGDIDDLEAFDLILADRIDRTDDRARAGTAVAIAMGGAMFLPDKTFNITGNVGTYRRAWAGALNVGALVSDSLALNAGVGKGFNKNGKVGARAGFTFGW